MLIKEACINDKKEVNEQSSDDINVGGKQKNLVTKVC